MTKDNEITEEEILAIVQEMAKKWDTQKALADHLKISNAYLNDILHGRRDISTAIARRLGYTKIIKFRKENVS
jgi:plasmid maintenance system antidote protein VapI